jgi:hypothetical protein
VNEMNREEIIRMAREAGVLAAQLLHQFGTEGALCDSEIRDLRAAERLAQAAYAAGAAAEREECANVAAWILKMPQNDVSAAIRERKMK